MKRYKLTELKLKPDEYFTPIDKKIYYPKSKIIQDQPSQLALLV